MTADFCLLSVALASAVSLCTFPPLHVVFISFNPLFFHSSVFLVLPFFLLCVSPGIPWRYILFFLSLPLCPPSNVFLSLRSNSWFPCFFSMRISTLSSFSWEVKLPGGLVHPCISSLHREGEGNVFLCCLQHVPPRGIGASVSSNNTNRILLNNSLKLITNALQLGCQNTMYGRPHTNLTYLGTEILGRLTM